MSNVIICSFDRRIRESIKAQIRDQGVKATLEDLIYLYPTQEVFIRAAVKNIIKRWRMGLDRPMVDEVERDEEI